ncbi:Uncharacterized protein Rs2_46285 [Raphanus sativus]|nr:Uncharacterized protein Rs2_46285 [Raphanus sativus]
MSSLSASATPVDENRTLSSGNAVDVESDEKEVTSPDPRWPYLNRWSSNLGIDVSTHAVSELTLQHPLIVTTVERESSASPVEVGSSASELMPPHPPTVIENGEEISTDSTILAPPAITVKETAELHPAEITR